MKVSKAIRDAHTDQRTRYELLKKKVDALINGKREERWHYFSRIKDEESYALKVETGRYKDPYSIDDFLACTLVVENSDAIPKAEKLIANEFTIQKRRPKNDKFTTKRSDSFRFDDLRIYVNWKDDPASSPTGLQALQFEFQVKTFLQHAWVMAVHDLIYKNDEMSWPQERIAFQIKAMLEHAETSIHEAQELAKSDVLAKKDDYSKRIAATIAMLNKSWPDDKLPKDKKRLAENIDKLIRNIGINLSDLKKILNDETDAGRGTNTLNLNPYGVVVQSIINQELDKIKKYLMGPKKDFKIYLCNELELPQGINLSRCKNAITDP